MNILMVRSDVALAGPGVFALRLALALKELGHSVQLATSGGQMVPRFEESGVQVHIVPQLALDQRGILATWRAMRRLRQIALAQRIDVMHSFNAHAALASALARRTTPARLVHTVLGTGKEGMNRLHAAPILAVSHHTRRRLIEAGIPAQRIAVIPPLSIGRQYLLAGEDLAAVREQRSQRRVCRFVSVAMFAPGKGQEQLLERFGQLSRESDAAFELVFVGDGPRLETCRARARELGIDDRVEFAGACKDVRPFLDQADCFVHHAVAETFGMVMVEAAARELPTIAADVGGIGDIVIDGQTGYLVDFDDNAGFIAALETMAGDPALRRRMGVAAQARIAAEMIQEVILERYVKAYEEA